MSTLKVLKEYLVGEDGYLLNDDNNGKTVMLSGAWGSGKTHFWLEDIKLKLTENNQKNIYISLYGKESIGELKFEVLRKAYNLEVKEDFISKTASMISSIAPSLGEKSLVDGYDKLNKAAKEKQAEEILKSGSIICLDDFERKSSKIDLNDLFGYISQLALDYNCKVVIILNSDVFEGEEANIFKTVKEKTVNKFFYFEPTIEELFTSIYSSDEKYKRLDDYKDEILSAIKLTEELNARIYIQVLDNCLEWCDIKNNLDKNIIKVLVLGTFNFILNHIAFDYVVPRVLHKNNELYEYDYKEINFTIKDINKYFKTIDNSAQIQNLEHLSYVPSHVPRYIKEKIFIDFLIVKNINGEYVEKNKKKIEALWKYGYRLAYIDLVDSKIYNEIINFIRTGILLKKEEEV